MSRVVSVNGLLQAKLDATCNYLLLEGEKYLHGREGYTNA